MCGIVGIWSSKSQIDQAVLRSMTDSLAHRGPDDSGIYIDEQHHIGLGHRRLSILDLSPLGHQPMSTDDATIWITYNGEVYNFVEIRDELIKKGYKFKSNSDTEVVLKSYEAWGIDCVRKFIGMFALGIWDRRKRELYLLRDRAGVKPLYYYYKNGLLLFGSELKALMRNPEFGREVDNNAVPIYLRYGYIPAPHTIFKNTYKLRPGHYLRITENRKIDEIKYWDIVDYQLQEPFNKAEDEILEELEVLLIDSFKYRLVSDVPVGVFLSGGIDSSILTALLQNNLDAKLKTFSIGFHESNFNEAEWAKKIADYLGTDHTEYYLSAQEAFNIVKLLPEIYDEPMADNSAIPTYLISKLTRNEATVALSADGGDELFCGYRRYWHLNRMHKLFSKVPRPLRQYVIRGLEFINPETVDYVYRKLSFIMPKTENFRDKFSKLRHMLLYSGRDDLANMYKRAVSIWSQEDLDGLISYDFTDRNDNNIEDTFGRLRDIDLLSRMMATDFKTYLPDDILTKMDRATMSVGLEGRDPLLDHRIAEYVARIPIGLKYRNGDSKYILKRILYKLIPNELLERPKMGFVAPLQIWFKKDLSELLQNYLNGQRLKKEGIFNAKAVDSLVRSYLKGSTVNFNMLWSLLMFEMWKEKWNIS